MFVEELADLAFATPDGAAAAEVRGATTDHVVDTVGALLVGLETLGGRLGRLADDLGLDGAAGGVSSRRRIALIGGAAAHAWEADDLHHEATVCPGSVVLPALMAATLVDGSLTWGRFLDACRAGYDVVVSAARATGSPRLLAQGWWPTSLLGPLGAVAALGVAEGDRDTTAAALGIAAQQSGGAIAGSVAEADSRYLLAGMAADRGVVAHAAATSGWSGPADFFDAGRTPLPRRDAVAPAACGAAVRETSFKPYPAAQHLQAAVEALLELVGGGLAPDDIDAIECALPEQIAAVAGGPPRPASRLAALVNGPFVLASAVLSGRLTTAEYADDRRDAPEVLRLAERVRIVPDAGLGRAYPAQWGAEVRVTVGGASVSARRAAARGSRGLRLTSADVDRKFRENVDPLLGETRAVSVLAAMREGDAGMPARDVLPREAMRLGEPEPAASTGARPFDFRDR